jgi:hypothetical protein
MASGGGTAVRGLVLVRRLIIWRVSAIDICALLASRLVNSDLARRTSTELRMATTVAVRGSSVYRLISPITSPRPISRTMRSTPSSPSTEARRRPLIDKYMASPGSPWTIRVSPAASSSQVKWRRNSCIASASTSPSMLCKWWVSTCSG